MDYSELVKDLREHRCYAKEDDTQDVCDECAYDVILADKSTFSGIKDVCTCGQMHRAADAIEQLLREQLHADCVMGKMGDKLSQLERKLCGWCGVCPEDKQNVWDCEIAFPELQVPEVSIEPPTYPCSDCVHYPPSSTDGKPCCACDPANPLTNCHEAKEKT